MAKKRGRPTKYNKKLADAICARIMEGQSVREIGRDETMPADRTVFRWLASNSKFCQQYTRAKEIQSEYMAEEMLEISDDAANDYMARNEGNNPGWEANGEHIQRSRLRIETRKWLMGKLKPKKYGDKQSVEHTGEDGGPLVIKWQK